MEIARSSTIGKTISKVAAVGNGPASGAKGPILMGVERLNDPNPLREEKALVGRMLAGDQRAQEKFADAYIPGLYRFALSRLGGNVELTQDIVQTTLCKTLEKLESFRAEAPLLAWLCACCRNEIGMHLRRSKGTGLGIELEEKQTPSSVSTPASDFGAPDTNMILREEAELVHLALDHLPSRYARALEWKYLDHLSVGQIGEKLRLGYKATESLLTRARRTFENRYRLLVADGEGRGFIGRNREACHE